MVQSQIAFQTPETIYYADSCEPLKTAVQRGEVLLDAWSHGDYPGIKLPANKLPTVRTLGMWNAETHQSWGLDTHCNEGIEFTFLLKGQLGFEVDGKFWNLKRSALTITRPWQFHRVGNPEVTASQLIWLILDVHVRHPHQKWQWPPWLLLDQSELNQLTRLLSHNEQPVWRGDKQIERCFVNLANLLENSKTELNETRLKLYINDLLVSILDMLTVRNIELDKSLSSTQHSVEVFLSSLPRYITQSWNLNTMAAACGLSRSQFTTYCKQFTNMAPIDYLNACRIQIASHRLHSHPSESITDIAYHVGFNSSQYFSTVFKAHMGCTPSAFRKQSKQSRV